MTAPDLISLIEYRMALADSLSEAWERRRANRLRNSQRSRKGAETKREKAKEALRAPAAFGVTALSPSGSSPAVSPASPLQSAGAGAGA